MNFRRGVASLLIVIVIFSTLYYAYATPVSVSFQTYQAVQGLYAWAWFQNSAYPPSKNAPPRNALPNMITTQSTATGKNDPYTLGAGQYEYLAPPAFSNQTAFSGGICTVIIYATGTSATIKIALVILNSKYSVVQTIATSSIGPFTSNSPTELVVHFAYASFTVPAGDFLALQLSGSGNPSVYWGNGYPTGFQVGQYADSA